MIGASLSEPHTSGTALRTKKSWHGEIEEIESLAVTKNQTQGPLLELLVF